MHSPNTIEGFHLSPQQRRLWNFQQTSPNNAAPFCSQLVVLLQGDLKPEILRQALEATCRRHEILRTTFRRMPGLSLPVQSVTDIAPSWEMLDLHGSDATRIEEFVRAEPEREFDYENGPLVY